MNNTKWAEFCSLPFNAPGPFEWRFKNVKTGSISSWSTNHRFYESIKCAWEDIEWLEIKFNGNAEEILSDLRKIHVPGTYNEGSVIIFGYSEGFIDFL